MKINQILDKIDENQIFVPAFQREYVWKRDNAKNLIASLIKEYPTGTMLTWETDEPPELKGKWKYDERQGAVKLILDGQQRITTLYMLIRGEVPPYYSKAEITHDTRGLYVNIETLELQYFKKSIMSNNPFWINVTDIFQKKIRERDVLRSISDNGEELTREREDLISDNFRAVEKIPDLEFVEQSIPIKAKIREAIDIFYIVNDSGVNLTDAELALAQISGYWPQAREKFKQKLTKLKENGFVFKLDFIVYCLLGILHNIGSDMTKLHGNDNFEKIKAVWNDLDEKILDYVVSLMRTHAYVDHTKEINSVYALVPIIVYIHKMGDDNISQQDINKIVKWFYYSQIRQRYISQTPQKLDKDIGIVVRSDNPFDELINIIKLERPLEILPEEFEGVDVRNALYSLMRWYFKSKNAICLTTGIGIRQNMGSKYALEWDHIFPYSILKDNGYSQQNRLKYPLAQEITNRVILTQTANRSKSNKYADDYLKSVKEKLPDALKLQSIPEDENLWKLENFEDFLRERRSLLTKQLNKFLEDLTKTEELPTEVSLDEIIKEGESNELEFKSSLRWSYQEEKVDKGLETIILRTLAGFANGYGGSLLIGVNDEGEVIGLDRDYSSLNGDKDEFEIHLRNIINRSFDKVFATTNIHIEFPELYEKEICKIHIKPTNKPIYLEIKNKDGNKVEKFFVRSGNSTPELNIKEASEYIKEHFA